MFKKQSSVEFYSDIKSLKKQNKKETKIRRLSNSVELPVYLKAKSEMQATIGSEIFISFFFAAQSINRRQPLKSIFNVLNSLYPNRGKHGTLSFHNRDGGESEPVP